MMETQGPISHVLTTRGLGSSTGPGGGPSPLRNLPHHHQLSTGFTFKSCGEFHTRATLEGPTGLGGLEEGELVAELLSSLNTFPWYALIKTLAVNAEPE